MLAGGTLACADGTPTQPAVNTNSPAASTPTTAALSSVPDAWATPPTGERILGKSALEAVYDAENPGAIGYVSTPMNAPMHANWHSWAPFYVVVYPSSAKFDTPLLCQDMPNENCPDHGPELAGLAQQMEPDVYGGGVRGHDHIMDYPGGDDFNVAWKPVAVIFTNAAAAQTRLMTDTEIANAVANGDAEEIPLPQLTFHCAAVSAAVWARGTPVSPAG